MLAFLKNRLKSHVHSEDTINVDYKSARLPVDLSEKDINFSKTRASVRLSNQNVLTPKEEEERVSEVLAFNFGK